MHNVQARLVWHSKQPQSLKSPKCTVIYEMETKQKNAIKEHSKIHKSFEYNDIERVQFERYPKCNKFQNSLTNNRLSFIIIEPVHILILNIGFKRFFQSQIKLLLIVIGIVADCKQMKNKTKKKRHALIQVEVEREREREGYQ